MLLSKTGSLSLALVMGNYQYFWTTEVSIVKIIRLSIYLVVY